MALDIATASADAAKAWLAKLDASKLDAYRYQRDGIGARTLKSLDPKRVNDPALRAAIEAARVDTSAIANGARLYSRFLPYGALDGKPSKHGEALAGYPLASNVHGKLATDHFYVYVNAVYAATPKGDNPSPDNADTSAER